MLHANIKFTLSTKTNDRWGLKVDGRLHYRVFPSNYPGSSLFPCCPALTFVPYTQDHPGSTPSSLFPRSPLPESPATREPVKDVKYRTEHTRGGGGRSHHGVQSQRMVAPRGPRRVVPVPEVLQLLLGFVQHLYALGVFLLQLLKLLASLEVGKLDPGCGRASDQRSGGT